jgi:hypothetical protein
MPTRSSGVTFWPSSVPSALVVVAHPFGGGLERGAAHGRQAGEGRLQLGLRDLELADGGSLQAVEALGVLEHGRVAAAAHVGEDLAHALLDRMIRLLRPMQHMPEGGIEVGSGGGEVTDLDVHGVIGKLPTRKRR